MTQGVTQSEANSWTNKCLLLEPGHEYDDDKASKSFHEQTKCHENLDKSFPGITAQTIFTALRQIQLNVKSRALNHESFLKY